MTYHSPGLSRSSFLSATAGSSSSSSGAASAATSDSSAGAASASSLTASTFVSSTVASASAAVSSTLVSSTLVSSMTSTLSAEGDSPSKEVTCLSSLNSALRASAHRPIRFSAEYQHHELGQAQVDQADQRHHERQKDQHHGGVVDHLLAVRPDHLAQLGDDLRQEGPDEGERVARRPISGLLGGLLRGSRAVLGGGGLGSGRQVDGLAGVLADSAAPRPLACRALRPGHHCGLPAGVTGVFGIGAVACGAGTIALVAHRMPFVWGSGGSLSSVHTCRVFS